MTLFVEIGKNETKISRKRTGSTVRMDSLPPFLKNFLEKSRPKEIIYCSEDYDMTDIIMNYGLDHQIRVSEINMLYPHDLNIKDASKVTGKQLCEAAIVLQKFQDQNVTVTTRNDILFCKANGRFKRIRANRMTTREIWEEVEALEEGQSVIRIQPGRPDERLRFLLRQSKGRKNVKYMEIEDLTLLGMRQLYDRQNQIKKRGFTYLR